MRFLPLIFFIGVFHIVFFQQAIFPPDVAADEARLAQMAERLTKPDDVLYLTNYYFPTTRVYSRRQVYALYADVGGRGSTWWILPKSAWGDIVKKDRVFVITTKEEMRALSDYLNPDDFAMLASSGDKLLLGKKTNQ